MAKDIDIQEQAYWLLLAFKSKLPARIINDIIMIWCQRLGRPLQDFFHASSSIWEIMCDFDEKMLVNLQKAAGNIAECIDYMERLAHNSTGLLTVLDADYPTSLKLTLNPDQLPPLLCYIGDLQILNRQSIAIIGSRDAGEMSLTFACDVARYFAEQGVNVISGNARGVDQAAHEGATSAKGYTTLVLPHGISKLNNELVLNFKLQIESGHLLVLSQFHPNAPWLVSSAMQRNKVVTGLSQLVIVAESNIKGGTWHGANSALTQKRPLYIHQNVTSSVSSGNNALIERGGIPLLWPAEKYEDVLEPLLYEGQVLHLLQYTEPAIALYFEQQKKWYNEKYNCVLEEMQKYHNYDHGL